MIINLTIKYMSKDFDTWNTNKKQMEDAPITKYVHPREIWWCSLGLNIRADIDGNNDNFERPVIVIKVYNKETMLVVPLTTKKKNNSFHYKIEIKDKVVWAKLTQIRVISNKRLSRKMDLIDDLAFAGLKDALIKSL